MHQIKVFIESGENYICHTQRKEKGKTEKSLEPLHFLVQYQENWQQMQGFIEIYANINGNTVYETLYNSNNLESQQYDHLHSAAQPDPSQTYFLSFL